MRPPRWRLSPCWCRSPRRRRRRPRSRPAPPRATGRPSSRPSGARRSRRLDPVGRSDRAPAGFELTPDEAVGIALDTDVVRAELEESPDAVPRAYTQGPCRWQVSFVDGDSEVARVAIDDRTGDVLEAWRDQQVGSELARGYEGAIAQTRQRALRLAAALRALPGAVLRPPAPVAPAPPRPAGPARARRLALLLQPGRDHGLGGAHLSGARLRLRPHALVGACARGGARARSSPWSRCGGWRSAAVALAIARIALNVADSQVIDVGVAGVVGADRITHGEPLYEGAFSPGIDLRGDVYGPVNYLAYVPFEAALPWDGEWDDVPAAHAAAIVFDLLTAVGLLALGRRLRRGAEGRALGVALGFAWLAYPFTLYTMNANANDALVAASVVWAMVALASPGGPGRRAGAGRGGQVRHRGAGAAVRHRGRPRDRRRRSSSSASPSGSPSSCVFLPFVPDGGPAESSTTARSATSRREARPSASGGWPRRSTSCRRSRGWGPWPWPWPSPWSRHAAAPSRSRRSRRR